MLELWSCIITPDHDSPIVDFRCEKNYSKGSFENFSISEDNVVFLRWWASEKNFALK